jgi:hypothetical protein
MVHATISFTMTAAATIYGYFVLDSDGDVAWAEKLDTPIVLPSFGGTVTIQPTFSLKSPLA